MLKPLSDDEVQSIVDSAIEDAIDYIDSFIAPDRIIAQRYVDGKCDVPVEDGRSGVVSTKCRDVVRAVKPSLMRVFLKSERIVEFIPRGPEDVKPAEQATEYANWSFQRCDGYRVISDVFHDALVKKVGVAKAYYKEDEKEEIRTIHNQPVQVVQQYIQQTGAEIIAGEDNGDGTVTVQVQIRRPNGKIVIESVPPEEFFINPDARDIGDFYVCGHQREGRVSDLIEMGFDFEDVADLDASGEDYENMEDYERRAYSEGWDENVLDPSMRRVTITEAYMRVDVEGTGKPQLYQFICGGSENRILRREMVEEVPFAVFEVDPEPHTFFGHSLVDLIKADQDAATSLLRGVIDNTHASNNPRLAFNTEFVNPHDAINNEIGAPIRVNGRPGEHIMPVSIPFTAGETLPFLTYYDDLIEQKTGVTRASMGLDADALRGATATAVAMADSGSKGHIEVMARNLAEGGMKQLFRLLLVLIHRHPDENAMMRLNGQFVPVDPASWDVDYDMSVSVGLGTGQEDAKMLMLRETIATQQGIWMSGGGPKNGLVSLTTMRHALADYMALAGLRNPDRYYLPMTEETEAALLAQIQQEEAQAAAQAQQSDPNAAFMQIEQMKVQQRAEADQGKQQVEMRKLMMQDDRERDKIDADLILRAAEILGKFGIQVDQQQVQQAMAAPRPQPV